MIHGAAIRCVERTPSTWSSDVTDTCEPATMPTACSTLSSSFTDRDMYPTVSLYITHTSSSSNMYHYVPVPSHLSVRYLKKTSMTPDDTHSQTPLQSKDLTGSLDAAYCAKYLQKCTLKVKTFTRANNKKILALKGTSKWCSSLLHH